MHKRANLKKKKKNHQNCQCLSVTSFCNQYRYSRHFSSFLNCYPCFISERNRNCCVGLNRTITQNPTLSVSVSLIAGVPCIRSLYMSNGLGFTKANNWPEIDTCEKSTGRGFFIPTCGPCRNNLTSLKILSEDKVIVTQNSVTQFYVKIFFL